MIEVDTEMCRYFVNEGLTEDSVSALLHRGQDIASLHSSCSAQEIHRISQSQKLKSATDDRCFL